MTVAPQSDAIEVRVLALKDGRNVIDAAIARAFAQIVVDPSICGIAGWTTGDFSRSRIATILIQKVQLEVSAHTSSAGALRCTGAGAGGSLGPVCAPVHSSSGQMQARRQEGSKSRRASMGPAQPGDIFLMPSRMAAEMTSAPQKRFTQIGDSRRNMWAARFPTQPQRTRVAPSRAR